MNSPNALPKPKISKSTLGKLAAVIVAASFATGCVVPPALHAGPFGISPSDVHNAGRHISGAVSGDAELILSHGYGHNRGHKRPARRHRGPARRHRGSVYGSYYGQGTLPALLIGTAVVLAVLAGISSSDEHDHDHH